MFERELHDAVAAAAARPEVLAAVGRVYAQLQRAIDDRRPVCHASGRCCRFDEFGHRLYVSTLELAAFVGQPQELPVAGDQLPEKRTSLPVLPTANRQPPTDTCPYQEPGTNLCTVHTIRPFGCRMFFCDATATDWQNAEYERVHAELKALHAALDVPYFYVEWRAALAALGATAPVRLSRT